MARTLHDTAEQMASVLRFERIRPDDRDTATLALINNRFRPHEIEALLDVALDAVRRAMAKA